MTKERYISRVEHKSGNSGFYWVRFLKGTSAKGMSSMEHRSQKSFTDRKCGGKEEALKQAIAWRDNKMKEYGLTLDRSQHNYKVARGGLLRGSVSGVVGVTNEIQTKGDGIYFAYRAGWSETIDGKRRQRGKMFWYDPTVEGSEQIAFKRAKAYRRKMVKLHYDFERTGVGLRPVKRSKKVCHHQNHQK